MTGQRRRKLELQLTGLRAELVGGRHSTAIEPDAAAPPQSRQDEDEQPLNEMLKAIASGRNRAAAATLVMVDRALARLREDPDTFGLCEDCEEPISAKRLEAVPYAVCCLPCAARRDGPKGPANRRKLTDFL
jgi:DnaK suppressor protein